jgi:dienelactone hydrolase
MTNGYRETVAQFGPDRGLTGVLTRPASPRADAPTVVVLNSGIIHRVGSNRVAVTLARAFAELGVTTLRFDLAGIGDSERRRDVPSLRDSVERDVTDALDFCAGKVGSQSFVLMGLCSGAYDAFHAARGDARVVGALLVDLPGPFRNRGHTMHHLKSRLLRPASWRNPFRKLAHYYAQLTAPAPRRNAEQKYVLGARSFATRAWMEEHLAAVLARSVKLGFVFTRGLEANYNHESQFRDVFPDVAGHPCVSHTFFPMADHAFTSATERARLVQYASTWLSAGWLADAHRPSPVPSQWRT